MQVHTRFTQLRTHCDTHKHTHTHNGRKCREKKREDYSRKVLREREESVETRRKLVNRVKREDMDGGRRERQEVSEGRRDKRQMTG